MSPFLPLEKFNEIRKLVPMITVNGILRNLSGNVLVLKRNNEPFLGEYWVPGGYLMHGESISNCLKREIKEETNLDVKGYVLSSIVSTHTKTAHVIEFNFLVYDFDGDFKINSEHSDVKWISSDEKDMHPGLKIVLEGVNIIDISASNLQIKYYEEKT